MAARAGIPVYTVALGTDDPGGQDGIFGFAQSPDRDTLRRIAETTGGEYFSARSAPALASAYGDLGSRLGRAEQRTEVTFLVVAAAALSGLAGRGGPSRDSGHRPSLITREVERGRCPGAGVGAPAPGHAPHAGRMFWFTRKTFSGSYSAFTRWRRG